MIQTNRHAQNKTVKKRHVFYMNGFDPRGLSHFYEVYKTEAQKQAKVMGYTLTVSERQTNDWTVRYEKDSHNVETTFEYLPIDAITRAQFLTFGPRFILRALRYYWAFFTGKGIAKRTLTLSKGTFIMFAFPFFCLLLMLALLTSSATLFFCLSTLIAPLAPLSPLSLINPLAAGLGIWLSLFAVKWIEKKTKALWLINAFYFILRISEDDYDELQSDMDALAKHMASSINASDADEILIAGMSFGTIFLVPMLAALQPQLKLKPQQSLSLLTLGQCISFVTAHRPAKRFKQQLSSICHIPMHWYDFTAPIDAACGPLAHIYDDACMPYDTQAPGLPRILSAQFHKMFTAEQYKALKKDFFRVHLQYLMATQLPSEYDFFTTTTAELTLHARFKHRKPVHTYTTQR